MWEQRFGFPTVERLVGGHRRYTQHDVDLVRDVVRLRERGVRLDEAIEEVLDRAVPLSPSVFATLRSRHPQLEVARVRKSTLLALSWAVEDQAVAMNDRAMVWGIFQHERHYRQSTARWHELARVGAGATALSDFSVSDPTSDPRRAALPADSPMRREWGVVVDCPDLPVALSAWEPPGQGAVADRDRVFETIWSIDPMAVRDAARVCAEVCRSIDPALHSGRFATPPPLAPEDARPPSTTRVTGLVARTATYLDQFAR